jgi:5-methylthioribose kinase
MIFKLSESHTYEWHIKEAAKLSKEIRALESSVREKKKLREFHLEAAQTLMQGQLSFGDVFTEDPEKSI